MTSEVKLEIAAQQSARPFAAIVAHQGDIESARQCAAALSQLGMRRKAFASAEQALRWERAEAALWEAEQGWRDQWRP